MRPLINLTVLLLLTSFCNGQIKYLSPDRIEAPEGWTKYNLLEVVNPEYPVELREKGVSGSVVTKLVIDKEGSVVSASAGEGDPALMEYALKAVKQWKFRPYVADGRAVEVETTATIDFSREEPYVRTSKPLKGPLRLRISQGVAQDHLIRKVNPQYPEEARAKRIRGDVILKVTIDHTGHVINPSPVTGDPLLAQAALDAVKQWTYKPYTLNGEAVDVETTVKISFRM